MIRSFLISILFLTITIYGVSQNIELVNVHLNNIVYPCVENEFLIKQFCCETDSLKITATTGTVEIRDSLLIWYGIENVEPALIINDKDSLQFEYSSLDRPRAIAFYEHLYHNNLYHSGELIVNSCEYEILDFDLLFLPSLEEIPIYIKIYGAKIPDAVLEIIKKRRDDSKLLITNIRFLNLCENSVMETKQIIEDSGRYFSYNSDDTDLKRYIELNGYIQDSILVDKKLYFSDFHRRFWVKYAYDDGFILLKFQNKLVAKFKKMDDGNVQYMHYVNEKKVSQGLYMPINKTYSIPCFDPKTYEEFCETKMVIEYIKIGEWKFFDQNEKVVKIRAFDNGIFVKEFDFE